MKEMTDDLQDEYMFGVLMNQYSLRKGLKLHGQCPVNTIVKELTQIHDIQTFSPMKYEDTTNKKRNKRVSSLMFVKENRTPQ